MCIRDSIMSIQHHLRDQVVDAEPSALLCAKCLQKMRVMRARQPRRDGKHAHTNASAVTVTGSTWPFIDRGPRSPRIRSPHAKPKIVPDYDCSVAFAAKSHDQARYNPDEKGPRDSAAAIRT